MRPLRNNPYLWQAWGVFEAEGGNRRGAEAHFKKALDLDPRNVCSLTARADLYLEHGLYSLAEKDLAAAHEVDASNPYVAHLSGRLAFYLGQWARARDIWGDMLLVDRRSLFPLQSMAHMARRRGFWKEAEDFIGRALTWDPENLPYPAGIGFAGDGPGPNGGIPSTETFQKTPGPF